MFRAHHTTVALTSIKVRRGRVGDLTIRAEDLSSQNRPQDVAGWASFSTEMGLGFVSAPAHNMLHEMYFGFRASLSDLKFL